MSTTKEQRKKRNLKKHTLLNKLKKCSIIPKAKTKRRRKNMFEKLEAVEKRYEELTKLIADPEVIANQAEWQKLMKEHASIEDIVLKFREYKKVKQGMEEAEELIQDPEMKELAEIEYYQAKENLPKIEEELKILLIPKDPDDEKNIMCEIRAGAGGEEAALFAGTLFRMYTMYAEKKHWKLEVLNENETGLGGYKEISFMITGKGVYSKLKFESGVHRVQRVPDTESSGRIHTSTATVAVLPVVEDVEIEINPADIKMEVFRASGAGGQHINKTSSAVRLIHEPSGIVVECQTERSQFQNKDNAMKMLRTKLYEIEKEKQDSEIANSRRTQVGSGDRSEKIRTYNYPQGRITDHRIGMSIYQMESFLNGDIDEMIDNLIAADRAERLKGEE
jgi:peptide chain release factor 1